MTAIEELPASDPTNQELFDKLDKVRAKVKQVRRLHKSSAISLSDSEPRLNPEASICLIFPCMQN